MVIMLKKTAKIILFSLLLLYLAACIVLTIFQRELLYHPVPATPENQSRSVPWLNDGETLRLSSIERDSPTAIMYFGGNADDVSQYLDGLQQHFPKASIYLMNYRGYAGSTGTPTEEGLVKDAVALFDMIHAKHPQIQVIGRSLGTGIAVQLAAQRPVTHLALITPYDSMINVAARHARVFPVEWLLKDKYDSTKFASKLKIPVALFIAELDQTIPPIHSEKLAQSMTHGSPTIFRFPHANHNNIFGTVNFWVSLQEALPQ